MGEEIIYEFLNEGSRIREMTLYITINRIYKYLCARQLPRMFEYNGRNFRNYMELYEPDHERGMLNFHNTSQEHKDRGVRVLVHVQY